MSRLDFCLLGPPRLLLDGAAVSIERKKALALLAYLALNDTPQSREVLAALFWPDYAAAQAFAYLRRAIWEIKEAIGASWLEADRELVTLQRSPDFWLDTAAFKELGASISAESGESSYLANLAAAVELYRGDFMAGFALPDSPQFEEWQFFQAEEYRRGLAELLEKLCAGYAQRGEPSKAIAYARRWVSLDPLHEPAQRELMRLFALADQRSAALRQYELCAQTLKEQVGAEPQPETTALFDLIKTGAFPGQVAGKPVHTKASWDLSPITHGSPNDKEQTAIPQSNLPAQFTRFIGRTQELADLGKLLDDPTCRILTLLGPGGVGKTRLSLKLAEEKRSSYKHGVYFIALAGIDSPDGLLPAFAKALGLTFSAQGGDNRQQLLAALLPRQALVVLDNFEHLISEETVGLLLEIAAEAHGVKLLVTSRIGLNVAGEQHYLLAGMRTPETPVADADPQAVEAYSAVKLFLDRARRADPDFKLTDKNQRAVIHICREVHGMPLAIELATAWLELLSPEEIAAEIERGLDFLESELRDLPPRQRSLRAIFNSTWQLLTPAEQVVFMKLSIFQGGFTRQAAQKVANASLKDLAALANKSLVWRGAEDDHRSQGRYEIHELLRQYANEQLRKLPHEWQKAHERLAETFAGQVYEDGERLKTSQQIEAYRSIEADLDNIRQALQWIIENHRFDLLEQMVYGYISYLNSEALERENAAFLEKAIQEIESLPNPTPLEKHLFANLLTLRSLSQIEWTTNSSVLYLQRAREIYQSLDPANRYGVWYAIFAFGWGVKIEDQEAIHMLLENLEEVRQRGDRWAIAQTLHNLGDRYAWIGAVEEARKILEEAADLFRSLGDQYQLASCLSALAPIAADHTQTENRLRQALAIYEQMGNGVAVSQMLYNLASAAEARGDYPESLRLYQRSLDLSIQLGLHLFIPGILSYASFTALRQGDIQLARQLRERSMAAGLAENEPASIIWGKWELGEIERVDGNLDAARRLYDESLENFEYSRTANLRTFYQRGLGDIAEVQGDYAAARQYFQKSLESAQADSHRWAIAYALCGLGRASTGLGNYAAANQYFRQAIEYYDYTLGLLMIALSGMAELYAAQADYESALTLATFVIDQPATWQEFRDRATRVVLRCIPRLPASQVARAQEKARNLDWEAFLIPNYQDMTP